MAGSQPQHGLKSLCSSGKVKGERAEGAKQTTWCLDTWQWCHLEDACSEFSTSRYMGLSELVYPILSKYVVWGPSDR